MLSLKNISLNISHHAYDDDLALTFFFNQQKEFLSKPY